MTTPAYAGKHAEWRGNTVEDWDSIIFYTILSSKITQQNQLCPKQSRHEDLSSMCVSDDPL